MFSNGLDVEPIGAIMRTIAIVEDEMRKAGIAEPMKLTAAISDGRRVMAIRHATSEQAPSMFYVRQPSHYMVVSEPLDDEDGTAWLEVPTGQLLAIEQGGGADLIPIVPG
jgi:glutamine amidotransferase